MHDTQAQTILDFWFVQSDSSKWFNGGDEFDLAIKNKFADLLAIAGKGDLQPWSKEARSALALIILIDQFSRNIFRHSKEMFAYDVIALNCCKRGLEQGFMENLSGSERLFFIMPLIHSEQLDDQVLGVTSLQKYCEQDDGYTQSKKFFDRHQEIIQRFGRFPHRNGVLGRDSTPEEVAFLNEPFSSF